MRCNIEVCLRQSRAVATMAALAVVFAANGSASADDSSPAAPRPVPPVDASSYGLRPPPVWPQLDEREQAVPLMGPTYVAVETKYTMLAGGGGLLVGGQAGWTLDPHWEAGFAGYGLVSGPAPQEDGRDASLRMAYGGLRGAYILRPRSALHLTLATLVGLGSVGTTAYAPMTLALEERSSSILFALEPVAEVELNLSDSVRLAATASYRYLANPELPSLDSAAVSGAAAGMALKLGSF
jgi:hypothetical protein